MDSVVHADVARLALLAHELGHAAVLALDHPEADIQIGAEAVIIDVQPLPSSSLVRSAAAALHASLAARLDWRWLDLSLPPERRAVIALAASRAAAERSLEYLATLPEGQPRARPQLPNSEADCVSIRRAIDAGGDLLAAGEHGRRLATAVVCVVAYRLEEINELRALIEASGDCGFVVLAEPFIPASLAKVFDYDDVTVPCNAEKVIGYDDVTVPCNAEKVLDYNDVVEDLLAALPSINLEVKEIGSL